jgi:hypothetical protein
MSAVFICTIQPMDKIKATGAAHVIFINWTWKKNYCITLWSSFMNLLLHVTVHVPLIHYTHCIYRVEYSFWKWMQNVSCVYLHNTTCLSHIFSEWVFVV